MFGRCGERRGRGNFPHIGCPVNVRSGSSGTRYSIGRSRSHRDPDRPPAPIDRTGQGEHVKVIADRLVHANPMVTMTTYAHLFDGIDVAAAERLDEAWTQSMTDPGRTQPVSRPIAIHP